MAAERRRRPVGPVAGAALALSMVVLYAPIAQLVASSVNANPLTSAWQGFTDRWYREAFDNPAVLDAVGRSIVLAVAVALSAGVFGTAAVVAVRRRPGFQRVLRGTAAARVATPELVLAVALGVLLPLTGARLGSWTMWFGHTVLFSAYVVLVVGTRLASMNPGLEEAAADLGARPLVVATRVVLPHLWPAVAASVLLVAAFSFDDVLLSARLGGPQDTTLPLVILSLATRRPTPELDAIGTMVVAAGALAFAAALAVARWRNGRSGQVLGVTT